MYEEETTLTFVLGSDYVIPARGERKVRLTTTYDRDGQDLALEKVAYVPQLTKKSSFFGNHDGEKSEKSVS